MRTIRLKTVLSDEEANQLAGTFIDENHYDILLQNQDAKVYKPDGSLLLILRSKILPASVCKAAFPALRKAAGKAGNRGMAAGGWQPDEKVLVDNRPAIKLSNDSVRAVPIKLDGTVSNTSYGQKVESGIIGHFGRYPRIPYCRLTAFNINYPEKFAQALPFIRAVNDVFKAECPERYEAQLQMIRKTSKDFIINRTAFTTITVNKNWRTAVHKDAGDLKEGFGVMAALRAGKFKGCYLIFPKFRVAVNMQTRDVLLADVHEFHGNSPLIGVKGMYERISCVFYYRADMIECGSAEEELRRAKALGVRAGKGVHKKLPKVVTVPGF